MVSDRFHIVVSNHKRLACFVDNFQHIQKFDGECDRVYIFDCSPNSTWNAQIEIANRLTAFGCVWGTNLFFVRRRNWGVNHGAQLDYFRCLQDGRIPRPRYVAFMQEHYLDRQRFVKEDTLPEDAIFDLDAIAARFDSDRLVGCVFFARYGARVITSNPISDSSGFFGDGTVLLPGARRRGFCIDGGNFITRPELYLKWFAHHQHFLTKGDGSYGFSHVWEARLGQILYDQAVKWVDAGRNVEFVDLDELDALEQKRGTPVSKLWYDNRTYYFFYGRDQQCYCPLPLFSMLRYLRHYIRNLIAHARDKRLVFITPASTLHR